MRKRYYIRRKAFVDENGRITDAKNVAYAYSARTLVNVMKDDFKGRESEFEVVSCRKVLGRYETIDGSEMDLSDAINEFPFKDDGKVKRVWVFNDKF